MTTKKRDNGKETAIRSREKIVKANEHTPGPSSQAKEKKRKVIIGQDDRKKRLARSLELRARRVGAPKV